MTMDLNELAARVEALAGPDREMDILIALAQPGRFFNAGPKYDGAPDRIGMINPDGSQSLPGNAPDMLVPRYTASIDAAMTLVPKGWDWFIGNCGGIISASVNPTVQPFPVECDITVDAATPALALTAAALRTKALGAVHTLTEGN
jgi:hypothetical protein